LLLTLTDLLTAAKVWGEKSVRRDQYPSEGQMWPVICRIAFLIQPGLSWTKGPTNCY